MDSPGAWGDCRTLEVAIAGGVASIALARPDIHNAFDETSIAELTRVLRAVGADDSVRVVVLSGRGRSFCAGADLNWMQRMASFSRDENRADALALAELLRTLNELAKPTVAQVHGGAFGGGVGLVAACDIAIAANDSVFALSEARLGLIPATISPYVVGAIGARASRRLFLTAERFSAPEALRLGLVHEVAAPEDLVARVAEIVALLLAGGPSAQAASKRLVREVAGRSVDDRLIAHTAECIADVRASPEGREGVAAFLAKRRPSWRARD